MLLKIDRNAYGQLCYKAADDTASIGVIPVRAFPMSAPAAGISLVDLRGREIVWIAHLNDLDERARQLVEAELTRSEFMPEIIAVQAVSSYAMPSRWKIDTDRGETELVLKAEEDIRRLSDTRFLIAGANGIQFLIRDIRMLDKASRKRLDRFL
ncbi:MAG: cyanophycin metabolism-associated DUF1854 family protein [Burkholderiales bacterium]